jgi:small multidrug resistance pump
VVVMMIQKAEWLPVATTPRVLQWVLVLAAVYNVLWGAWVVLYPMMLFDWLAMPQPNYPELWQCVGMIVGCYGIGYAAAARDPYRHWPVVLVGLVGKVAGPLGFVKAVLFDKTFPLGFGVNILTNDLVWWVPFGLILLGAYKHHQVGALSRQRETS